MPWSEEQLHELTVYKGFRMRGLEMTRLETFTDAAFAFAITMLVISVTGIPRSYEELILALKDAPAFAASFATIASFWYGHHRWSRRYGLEDPWTVVLTLVLIFIMLVYIYPLKMVFSALFNWISNGRLPSNFTLGSRDELPRLFVVYGIGFFALGTSLCLLYLRSLALGRDLLLNEMERLLTREEIASYGVLSATGLGSALFAALTPTDLGIWSGFFYSTLAVSMPAVASVYAKRAERLHEAPADATPSSPRAP
jgi:hypothetical protein